MDFNSIIDGIKFTDTELTEDKEFSKLANSSTTSNFLIKQESSQCENEFMNDKFDYNVYIKKEDENYGKSMVCRDDSFENKDLELNEKMLNDDMDDGQLDSDEDEHLDWRMSLEAQAGETNVSALLPEKSKNRYEMTYELFKRWCEEKGCAGPTEKILLTYFVERSEILKSPSSLWCEYSMLKSTILINDSIDISKFRRLRVYLRVKNRGYRPKKSNLFTRSEIDKFLTEAPDDVYLMMKVVMIMGVAGACCNKEICRISIDDFEDKNDMVIVKIPYSKNNIQRTFTIVDKKTEKVQCLEIFRKYVNLRPKNTSHRRFFIRYQAGKCVNQVVGKNTLAKVPSEIAKFLNLENPSDYTGQSFRRTSAKLLANTGIDILSLKRYAGSMTSKEEGASVKISLQNKALESKDAANLHERSSDTPLITTDQNQSLSSFLSKDNNPVMNIVNCPNCSFSFMINK